MRDSLLGAAIAGVALSREASEQRLEARGALVGLGGAAVWRRALLASIPCPIALCRLLHQLIGLLQPLLCQNRFRSTQALRQCFRAELAAHAGHLETVQLKLYEAWPRFSPPVARSSVLPLKVRPGHRLHQASNEQQSQV